MAQPEGIAGNKGALWMRFWNHDVTQDIRSAVVWTAKKIVQIVKFVFIVTVSAALYLANPSLFALGFVVGLVIDDKVRETVAKVKTICKRHPWVVVVVGVGSFLALPVAIAVGSFVSGAYVSSKIAGMVKEEQNGNA